MLDRYVSQLKLQSDAFLRTSKTIRIENDNGFEFKRATIFTSSTFERIGYQSAFLAFFGGFENVLPLCKSKRIRAFNKIWDIVESNEFLYSRSIRDMDYFIEKYNEYENKRNDAVDAHRMFFDNLVTQFSGQTVPNSLANYLQEIDRITVDWQNLEDRTRPDRVHRHLVVALRILNRKNSAIPFAVKMNDNLLNESYQYNNMKNLIRNYNTQFFIYHRSFRSSSRVVLMAKKILKGCC